MSCSRVAWPHQRVRDANSFILRGICRPGQRCRALEERSQTDGRNKRPSGTASSFRAGKIIKVDESIAGFQPRRCRFPSNLTCSGALPLAFDPSCRIGPWNGVSSQSRLGVVGRCGCCGPGCERHRDGASDRRIQMVALAVVILILLPAISMTDDLVAAQNPAEIDCCAGRHHDHAASPHSIIPAGRNPAAAGLHRHIARFYGHGHAQRSPFSICGEPLSGIDPESTPSGRLIALAAQIFLVNFLMFRVRRADHGAKVLYEADLPFRCRCGNGCDPRSGTAVCISSAARSRGIRSRQSLKPPIRR